MNKSATTYAQSLTMSREEKRLERARSAKAWHEDKIRREKAWLAANPHIASQRQREKESEQRQREQQRIQREVTKQSEKATLLASKKLSGGFAALAVSDSETEDEADKEVVVETMVEEKQEHPEDEEKPDQVIRKKYKPMSYEGSAKKLNWADSDSDEDN
jgi:hypothetical protein